MSGSIGSNSSGNLELYSGSTKVLTADATTGIANFVKTPTVPTASASSNDTQVATTAMVHSAITNDLHVTGSAPMYACRAWVYFNGTGTPTIKASGNVSSITKNGTGDYTINFTISMPDANYCASDSMGNGTVSDTIGGTFGYNTSNISIHTRNGSNSDSDKPDVSVAIFR
jgi:hypothetical protein